MQRPIAALLTSVLVAALCGCNPPGNAKAAIEPQADQALRAMCRQLASAKAMAFHVAAAVDETDADGRVVQALRDASILMRRPDAIASEKRDENTKWLLRYKGDRLSVLREGTNQYATIKVPGDTDKMLDYLYEEYGLTLPLADLLFADPYKALTENAQTGVYLGLHTIRGRPCHHLLFTQEKVDWQIWIDSGEQALPQRVVITYKEEPGDPEFVADLTDWNLAPVAPDSAFDFVPPAGAKAVTVAELRSEEGE